MFLKILTVLALATFEIYAAIPTGFAFKLSPWVILFASLTGGLIGVIVTAYLGDKLKALFYKNKKNQIKEVKTDTLVHRIWLKFGIIGLGYLGTITVGAPLSIALGVGLNAPLHKLVLWCCLGVITRCIIFTLAGHYGLKLF